MSSGVSGKPVNAAHRGAGPHKKRDALASVATTDDDQRPTTFAYQRAQHQIRLDSPMNSPTFALQQPANAQRAGPQIAEHHRHEAPRGSIAHPHARTNIPPDASTRRINVPLQQGAKEHHDHTWAQLTQIPLCPRYYEPHVPPPSYLSYIGPELHASLLYHSKRMSPQPRQRGWYSSSKIDLMAPPQHWLQAGSQGLEQAQHISAGGGQYVFHSSALAQQPPPPPRAHVQPQLEKTSRRDRMSISFLIGAEDHDANLIRNTNSVHGAESEQRPEVEDPDCKALEDGRPLPIAERKRRLGETLTLTQQENLPQKSARAAKKVRANDSQQASFAANLVQEVGVNDIWTTASSPIASFLRELGNADHTSARPL